MPAPEPSAAITDALEDAGPEDAGPEHAGHEASRRWPPVAPLPHVGAFDARLIAILEAPLARGETAAVGYQRKEEAIGAVFATLSALESRALQARIAAAAPGDVLVEKLGRLIPERRQRLIAFLADVRRREFLGNARR